MLYPCLSTGRQIFQIRHSVGIKIEETRVAPRKNKQMNERTNERRDRRIAAEERERASIESPLTPTSSSSLSSVDPILFR